MMTPGTPKAEVRTPERIDLFDNTYSHFDERVLRVIRKETFGVDIGQNSWLTVDEYERFLPWLGLTAEQHLLRSWRSGLTKRIVSALGQRMQTLAYLLPMTPSMPFSVSIR
jgi:hypothetical protein